MLWPALSSRPLMIPAWPGSEKTSFRTGSVIYSKDDGVTQSSGAAVLEEADTRHEACIRFLRLFFQWQFRRQCKATLWSMKGRPLFRRVSRCVRSCWQSRVYPLSPVKANVGHLCEKLKNAIRSGLGQRCGGNFLAIFAGTILGEKPNFTGDFFEWRRPFDFSTR